jgi:hypothetical protein
MFGNSRAQTQRVAPCYYAVFLAHIPLESYGARRGPVAHQVQEPVCRVIVTRVPREILRRRAVHVAAETHESGLGRARVFSEPPIQTDGVDRAEIYESKALSGRRRRGIEGKVHVRVDSAYRADRNRLLVLVASRQPDLITSPSARATDGTRNCTRYRA